MPIVVNGIEIKITTTEEGSAEAAAEIKKVTDATEATGVASEESDLSFSGLLDSITLAINPLDLAQQGFRLLMDVVSASAEEYAQAELNIAQLDAVLRSTDGAAGIAREELLDLAGSLQDVSGVADDTIIRGEALLLTFTKVGQEVFPEAAEAALNMSMAMGTDLQSAIIQVGKALNEPIEGVSALRRVGVQLTEQQEEQIRAFMEVNDIAGAQKIILGELETQFGGIAETMGDTTVGAVNKLKNAWSDYLETQGEGNADAQRRTNEALTKMLEKWTRIAEEVNRNKTILAEMNDELYREYSAHRVLTPEMEALIWQYERGAAMTDFYSDSVETSTETLEENAAAAHEAAAAQSDYYTSVLDGAQKFYDINTDFVDKQEELRAKQAEVRQEIDALISNGWSPYSEKVQDLQTKYDDLGMKIDETAEKHRIRMGEMQYDLLMSKLSVDGITSSEYEMAVSAGVAFGVFDKETAEAMVIQNQLIDAVLASGDAGVEVYSKKYVEAMEDGIVTAEEFRDILDSIPANKDVNINVNVNQYGADLGSYYSGLNSGGGNYYGYSSGTDGWETVPPGYPNDSYPMFLESGEKFNVIPAGGPDPTIPMSSGAGGLGGSPVSITFQINSPITIMDEERAVNTLIPLMEQAWNELQSRGGLQ